MLEPCTLSAPRVGEVLVRLEACGICHTDLAAKDHDLGATLPAVLGHEGVGIIESLGDGVSEFKLGDRVLMSFGSCGHCDRCQHGSPGYCRSAHLGFKGVRADGSSPITYQGEVITGHFFAQSSFATHAIASTVNMVPVPAGLPAALMAPLACGVQTGMASVFIALNAGPDDSLAVFGCGTVGLAAIMAAKIIGCRQIVAFDLNEDRLALARELGATHAIAALDPTAKQQLKQLDGVSRALDCTGVPEVIKLAFNALKPQGVLACAGVSKPGSQLAIDLATLLYSGRSIRGTIEGDAVPRSFIPRMIQWYQDGLLPLDKLVTPFAFADINQAVAAMHAGSVIKPVLCMNTKSLQAGSQP